ncbi:MAG: phytoene desaturase [Alphaproteobacteria bacterium]|jgi:phytoene desaturase|nr:phytoene desaturase [Alphaproteobacteria bacterium]
MLTRPGVELVDTRPDDPRPHAVIIGSGFGGLAAAVRLGARGYRVTVLERLDQLGGRALVHREAGFTFDAGPTLITAPHLFEELWTLCGRRMADDIDLRALDPFYRIRFDSGESLVCHADAEAMRAEVARLAPDDLEGYDRFMVRSEAICRIGFEKLGAVQFGSVLDLIRQGPGLVALGGASSVYGLVSRFVRDERLRIALSFHPLFVGGHPFETTAVYCLISHLERRWGVHFAMGGTGALVRGLKGLLDGLGVEVRMGAEVAEIVTAARRVRGVRLADGETLAADLVVSNADAADTYRRLLPGQTRRVWTDRKLDRARYSMGLFVWYFGTRRRYEHVDHHTIVLGPRYRGLVDDIFRARPLAADMSLYLHRPTATDPSLAPTGCDAFYALSPVPHLDADIDWATAAEPYRQAVERRLAETVLPGLGADIAVSRVTAPPDFVRLYGSEKGAGFSLAPTLTQSACFRPHNESEEVAGLYLVGAGSQPGAGIPGVLSSAKIVDALVPAASGRV